MGFSTHQGFVYPEKEKKVSEIKKTINQIEVAYKLGIFNKANYRGYISYEFEGNENPLIAIPKGLEVLRENFTF